MRKTVLSLSLGLLLVGLVFSLSSFAPNSTRAISLTPASTLTQEDIKSLQYMIQEEKLARDVYLTLYNIYKLPVFNNITQSEQRHMDSVKVLLDKYGIQNPLKTDAIGKYADSEFEKLYTQLVEEGKKSITDALNVGAKIESLDIKDLEEAIAKTKNADLITVFNNLKAGSENHLTAFTGQAPKNTQNQTQASAQYGQYGYRCGRK